MQTSLQPNELAVILLFMSEMCRKFFLILHPINAFKEKENTQTTKQNKNHKQHHTILLLLLLVLILFFLFICFLCFCFVVFKYIMWWILVCLLLLTKQNIQKKNPRGYIAFMGISLSQYIKCLSISCISISSLASFM